jgi:cation diffusion facilitator CzcD-associated flavoprotein CzcO
MEKQVDILIIGAGISGIGIAAHWFKVKTKGRHI